VSATMSANPLSLSFRLRRYRGGSVSTISSVGPTCALGRWPHRDAVRSADHDRAQRPDSRLNRVRCHRGVRTSTCLLLHRDLLAKESSTVSLKVPMPVSWAAAIPFSQAKPSIVPLVEHEHVCVLRAVVDELRFHCLFLRHNSTVGSVVTPRGALIAMTLGTTGRRASALLRRTAM